MTPVPRTATPTISTELPERSTALSGRLGRTVWTSYDLNAGNAVPRRLAVKDRAVRLEGFPSHPHPLDVTATNRQRVGVDQQRWEDDGGRVYERA